MSQSQSSLIDVLETLKRNTKMYPESWNEIIAADTLAIAIYYTRAVKFGLPFISWDTVTDGVRDKYRDDARKVLEYVKPTARKQTEWFRQAVRITTGLHRPDHLIGTIESKDGAA